MIIGILRNGTNDSSIVASALGDYINITTTGNISLSPIDIIGLADINNIVENLAGLNDSFNSTSAFIVSQSPVTGVVGGLFNHRNGGAIISETNIASSINRNLSAAAFVSGRGLNDVTVLNILIIDEPTIYRSIDNSTNNKSVASSIIVVGAQSNTTNSPALNVSLFFQVLSNFEPTVDADYFCSFYDATSTRWNESGCSVPVYSSTYQRYECTCDHLTPFALVWSPKILQPDRLIGQDIASLVCLSIAIFAFIVVIIHALITRFPRPRDLFPLAAFASTTMLFIFYIAMTMTVYTRTPIASTFAVPCFTSASVLMFFVYFFLIFMFCVKTSVAFFNYLRFIRLFPELSFGKLSVFLIISFFIAIAYTSFAAGFNSNDSFHITQLHSNRLCWFSERVIYYFVTIPVGIFIVLSFIIIALVIKHIIAHARNATSPHSSYKWIKRGLLVLLTSCVTQGIGWLFGPFISFINPSASNVLGWFFVVFNGLEGVWCILFYITVRVYSKQEHMRINSASISRKTDRF